MVLSKMFIHSFIYLLLLLSFIGIVVYSQNVIKFYVIKKDFFNIIKASQFSIYDPREQQLYYRIQSKLALQQVLELIEYPSNQVIAKLNSRWDILLYKATISIFDSQSNQWIDGQIRQHFKLFGDKYTIEWNGESIVMETKFASFTTKFRDQNQDNILAKFRMRWFSVLGSNKYDLEIFSRQVPDSIYIFALAAKDYNDALTKKIRNLQEHRKN
ncbi:unnamed protein product [Rotaria sp. Silwood1]|nr:unnamed protein product [Rotaria sp. Silwood1]